MGLEYRKPRAAPATVDGASAVRLLAKIEVRNLDKHASHVIRDNAARHRGPDVRAFLAPAECRIHLVQLPPRRPHLNPIERLRVVMRQYVTQNRYDPTQGQCAAALLTFLRETIPAEGGKFPDQVTDNFRVISYQNLRVLQ